MAIIVYKPNNAGRRSGMSKLDHSDLSKVKPFNQIKVQIFSTVLVLEKHYIIFLRLSIQIDLIRLSDHL